MRDLSKLQISPEMRDVELDPVRIFASSTQRGTIEGLYGPQQEALTTWHQKHRAKNDVLFSLPTGGGKTVVGLLAAQSIVNETRGKVLYACATNQLVEQVRSQAEQCGLQVASYYESQWRNREAFEQGRSTLITNYHALFNGMTKFLDEVIAGIVFDDAHVAPNVLRDCFTIKLTAAHPAWLPLLQCLQPFFAETTYFQSFRRIQTPSPTGAREKGLLYVPSWFIVAHIDAIITALESNKITDEDTKFAYAHLRHHLHMCCFLIAHNRLEIGPMVLPTHVLPYFTTKVRRIYMTATLPSRYECIRTFGVDRAEPIIPTGKAGAAQRLFVFAKGEGDAGKPYDEARKLALPRKACIIVPSTNAGKKWQDIAQTYESKKGHAAIRTFAQATDNRKIILAALYDGIDLPGKSCNVLILDGLPRGAFLYDVFVEIGLDIMALKRANMASRIVQSIGRIFRSNTDHGVVILADKAQQTWLIGADHLPSVPPLLQQQIMLGLEIRKLVDDNAVTYEELMEAVINGRKDWDTFYNTQIAKLQADKKPKEIAWGDDAAKGEYQAFRDLWEQRYPQAADSLCRLARLVEKDEKFLSAWYLHWAALALLLAGHSGTSTQLYHQAACTKCSLGRPAGAQSNRIEGSTPGPQAKRVAKNWERLYGKFGAAQQAITSGGGKNAELHGDALQDLGDFLGFIASQPDRDLKTGPDVVWRLPELNAVVSLEAKTQKTSPVAYKKTQVGKLHDDVTWLDNKYPGTDRRVMIVGPPVPVVKQANPKVFYRVTPLSEFVDLLNRVIFAYQSIAASPVGDLEGHIEIAFRFQGLLWPSCVDAMSYQFMTDLQISGDDDEADESSGTA